MLILLGPVCGQAPLLVYFNASEQTDDDRKDH